MIARYAYEFVDGATQSLEYLDRLTVRAPEKRILLGFRLARSGNKMRYVYSHGKVVSSDPAISVTVGKTYEDFTDWNDGYLDRHTIDLDTIQPKNAVLLGFHLERLVGSDKVRFRYWYSYLMVEGSSIIVPAKNNLVLSLTDLQKTTTDMNDGANQRSVIYLDRHPITVGKNRVLTGFNITRPNASYNEFQYLVRSYGLGSPIVVKLPTPLIDINPSTWMGQYSELLNSVTLCDICIPGTHDAGLGPSATKFTNLVAGATNSTAAFQTQDHNVKGQLERGARWIELRPLRLPNGKYITYHGVNAPPVDVPGVVTVPSVGAIGGTGEIFESIIAGVNEFTARNPGEVIIITLSNGVSFDGAYLSSFSDGDWETFIKSKVWYNNGKNNINNVLIPDDSVFDYTTNLGTIQLQHLFGKVIILVAEDNFIAGTEKERKQPKSTKALDTTVYQKYDGHAKLGFYDKFSFSFGETHHFESDSPGSYFDEQLNRLKKILTDDSPRKLPILLNWTLTQNSSDAIASSIVPIDYNFFGLHIKFGNTIKDLGRYEHDGLVDHLLPKFRDSLAAKTTLIFPNIIPIDFMETDVLDAILWINKNVLNWENPK